MGRKPKLTPHQIREAIRRRDHGDETKAAPSIFRITRALG
jgi:hypothetical protein